MRESYRIAIADSDTQALAGIANAIVEASHKVVVRADSADDLFRGCRGIALDLIVSDINMLDPKGQPAAVKLAEKLDVPLIALSNALDGAPSSELNERIFAYLIKPICTAELLVAIPLATQRFGILQGLRAETLYLQRALEDRKLIERAKGIIMRQLTFDEARAFQHLRDLARSRRLKMSELARSIILAHETLTSQKGIGFS